MADHITLESWLALGERERSAAIAASGDSDAEVVRLGDECERLAVTHVAVAIDAARRLLAHAPARGRSRTRVLRALTTALAYAGRSTESLEAADSAIQAAEESDLPVDAARAIVASLHPLTKLGRMDEAVARGSAARSALIAAGELKLAARADLNLGNIRKSTGHVSEALEHLERARRALADEPGMVAHAENTLGETYLLRDEFSAARAAFESSARHFAAAGQRFAAAIVDGNLADLAGREGRLQDALRHFEHARAALERDATDGHVARLMAEEAEVLAALGLPAEALRALDSALARLDALGPTTEAARARLARARVLASLGRLDEARADGDAAVANATLRGDRWLVRLAQLLVAETLLSSDPARAGETAAAVIADPESRPVDRLVARHHLARALVAQGDTERARAELDLCISASREFGHAPITTDVLVARAALPGDAAASIRDLEEAVDLIEQVRSTLSGQRLRATWTGTRLRAFEALALAHLGQGTDDSTAAAFDAVERSKSRALLDLVQRLVDRQSASEPETRVADDSRRLRERFDRLRQRLNALYSRWESEGTPGARHALVGSALSPQAIRDEEAELDRLADRIASIEGHRSLWAKPLRSSEVQRRLLPGEALVEYFAAEGELLAFVVTRERISVARRLMAVDEACALVASMLFQMRRATRLPARDPERLIAAARVALGQLFDSLLRPIESLLRGAESLVVVPHGALHAVPFHALFDSRDGTYLIDRFRVRTAPSATLAHVGARERQRRTDALVVGVSDDAAPAIDAEVATVRRHWPDAGVLAGGDATASRVLGASAGAAIVHLACHGRFSEHVPNASGLKLADRWISVREVTELAMGADLVVLAGCETGRAAIQPGDEAIGLPRAFIAAGAAAVLVSLWPVRDDAALRFMSELHGRLAAERAGGASLGDVVREAMTRCRAISPHPASWGAFGLVGADPWATMRTSVGTVRVERAT